jgi:malate dehydrogenase (oxaloacetate-decarboxylating)(NADP+)
LVRQSRRDAILCTGRSDISNQVNNIVAFPYLLKSLVQTRTTVLTTAIKWQMAQIIAQISRDDGPDALVPRSLDPRLKNLTEMMIEYIHSIPR